jgi:signal transduction histidine kinase
MAFWVLSAASALLLAGLAVVLWVRRPPEALWPIAFACQILALLWVVGDLWASHAANLLQKQIALGVLFTGSLWIVAAWWETTRRYVVWHGLARRWMRSRWAKLPLWLAGPAWLFAITNPWHGQVLEPVLGARNEYRWGIFGLAYWNWGLTLATFALCAWAARRHASREVRSKMRLLALATLAPLGASLAHTYAPGLPREDATTALGLGLASATVIYGITRVRLFGLLPVALHEILRRDPDGVLLLDRGGRLLLWNPAAEKLLETLLLEPDLPLFDVLAKRLEAEPGGGRLSGAHELTELLTQSGECRPVFRYVGWGGERWLRFSVAPIPGRRGRIAAVCLRVEDATQEEQAARERRDRVERAHREERAESLALMAGGIAHDFNNLLSAIDGRVRLALQDVARGLPVRRHLRAILKSTNLAEELTAQLLSYAGRSPVKRGPVELSSLVEDMAELLRDALPAGATLQLELARSLTAVHADATQLRQVLLNLVQNAGQALGDDSGRVAVSTALVDLDASRLRREGLCGKLGPGRHVLLEVADDGCGMDETTSRCAFDAFFTTRCDGHGLGLALVAGIVESHGGAILLDTRPGGGSRLRVWLPASSDGASA